MKNIKRPNWDTKELFQTGKYKSFKKGDLYRDPRIKQVTGQADFLIIDNDVKDFDFLDKYLNGELPNYPSEEFNMYTTGVDKNNMPMIGLYWVTENMDQIKRSIILCRGGSETAVLEVVDNNCVEGETHDWEEGSNEVPPPPAVVTPKKESVLSLNPVLTKYAK